MCGNREKYHRAKGKSRNLHNLQPTGLMHTPSLTSFQIQIVPELKIHPDSPKIHLDSQAGSSIGRHTDLSPVNNLW